MARRVVVRLSSAMFAPLVEKPINQTTQVEDVILGTRVTGPARVQGHPTLEIVDDPAAAAFTVRLNGTIQSRTVGRNGPVTIRSRSETSFTASKRVIFKSGQGFVAEPSQIAARTRTSTEDIQADRRGLIGRIIERRAWSAVGQNRTRVEAIVRTKAERRVRDTFDRLVDTRIARMNRTADIQYAIAALVGGQGPKFTCCTSAGCLQIAAAGDGQPAISLPPTGQPPAPVEMWLHESIVGDKVAHLLKHFDQVRRSGSLVEKMLQAFPSKAKTDPPQAVTTADEPVAVDYVTAGDWIVVQLGKHIDRRLAANPANGLDSTR